MDIWEMRVCTYVSTYVCVKKIGELCHTSYQRKRQICLLEKFYMAKDTIKSKEQ